jgi:excisionase family DNA binding protein
MEYEKQILEKLGEIELKLISTKSIQTLKECALYTGKSESDIYKKTALKLIPHYKNGKHLYFVKEEIDKWLLGNKVKTQSEIESEAYSYLNKKRSRF